MNRRTFSKLAAMTAVTGVSDAAAGTLQKFPVETAAQPAASFIQTYRRLLVDTHVPDWDPRLLARFDPVSYADTIADAHFQSFMQYANSHAGLCLWPTKLGQAHANMKDRDYFGEVMKELGRRKIHRMAYYSLIFDDWAFQTHADWRIVPDAGDFELVDGRLGTVCPNSPYREHSLACLRELVGAYEFEGIFLDMTFWPAVCYCAHCSDRFRTEYHAEPPRIVDWNDPVWRSWQKAREDWMVEYVKVIYKTIKELRNILVYQQFSTVLHPWFQGVSLNQREASDFCGGDFYGGPAQFSLVCKTYDSLTRNKPFEFMTSRTSGLGDFETTKSYNDLLTQLSVPTIHSAAYFLIDAIRPDGTLNKNAYRYMNGLNELHARYEPYLGGDLLADVALYFDKNSMYDPKENGMRVSKVAPVFEFYGRPASSTIRSGEPPHLTSLVGFARVLREAHIPYSVVTNVTLDQLKNYRAVVVPNVLEMTEAQAEVFRQFVHSGGVLIATGTSSLQRAESGKRFLLEDVLGVKYLGIDGEFWSYLTPQDDQLKSLGFPQENFSYAGPMVKAQIIGAGQKLASVTLPFVSADAGNSINRRFAQIWSNPPDTVPGTDPGIVLNSFGKGRSIWIAAPIETATADINSRLLVHLIRRALPGPYYFEADGPSTVEMTVMVQPANQRLLLGFLNMPLDKNALVKMTARIAIPKNRRIKKIMKLPDMTVIPHQLSGPYAQFHVDPFEVISMALMEYE